MKKHELEEALFPVATITAGAVPSHEAMLIRLDFLTHASQRPEDANPGRNYLLTAPQAKYLAQRIADSLQILETAGPQGGAGPKH